MRIQAAGQQIVIGKRVTLGAAINSIVLILGLIWPEHQQVLLASAIPLTFLAQVLVAHKLGITTHE